MKQADVFSGADDLLDPRRQRAHPRHVAEPDRTAVALRRAAVMDNALDLLVAWVAHDQLHLAQLAGTLARLWANRWPEQKAEYAGPIPYESR